jgi:CHRD domain
MKRSIAVALVGGISLLAVVSIASASHAMKPMTVKFSAALNTGQEVPRPTGTTGGSGHFSATLSGMKLTWTLTYAHLSGPALQAHIHSGSKGQSGPVLIPLCPPCTSPKSGSVTLTAKEIADMEAGKDYVNVHTAKNPNGEIRGQITHSM